MKMRLLVVPFVAGLLVATPMRAADTEPPAASSAAFHEIAWEELVPEGWDPLKGLRGMGNLGMLDDSNPRVLEAMREMRRVWNTAPTNDTLDGAAVKLPGYVVPLEQVKDELKEFLLVPYFGACIHNPPPPANQIVHVLLDKPVKGYRSMDTVWVSGTLKTFRQDSAMGASGYRMQAAVVDRYEAATQR
ncbi:MAG: DUF3299 domain-containing protein [Methylibium sp.]|uniref:DUF3299 domain-containing protein n=1 Tax=Methylibium sp. TaxID=2067992 RepID=UPI0017F30C0D|nr:DUF3299 domain-containing protein [Methylibium sp.]MBA3598409.1 DUF3299 domain-containing protein [Methylibium sp.]